MDVIAQYLDKTKDLTIMPPVLLSVLNMKDDNELPFDKLEQMVQSDQILVSRMLNLANSPFYHRGQRIQSIRQILTRLGFRTVRSMITLAFMDSIFSNGNYTKFRKEIWEHSIATAVMSQFLCDDLQLKKERDVTLLGGLLKDLGKVLLNTIDRRKYIELLTRFLESDVSILQLEREYFQVDSVEIGTAVAKQWRLPEEILTVITRIQDPITEIPLYVQLISLAEMIARKAGFGKYDEKFEGRYQDLLELFGIDEQKRINFPDEYRKKLMENELYRLCYSI